MSDHIVHRNARIAGAFYLLTFLTGLPAFFIHSSLGVALGLIAAMCYIAVTLLFYYLFKPVNRTLSLLAAFVSLAGCASGALRAKRPLGYCLARSRRISPSDRGLWLEGRTAVRRPSEQTKRKQESNSNNAR